MNKDKISESAIKIRELINKAIESGKLTRKEYDNITHIATEDGHIDRQEKILLGMLHDLLEDKTIKIVKNEKN